MKDIVKLAHETRLMLEGSKTTLLDVIHYNTMTQPKPGHMNRPIMDKLLKLERDNGKVEI